MQKYLPRKPLFGMWGKAKELGCNPDDLMDAACLAVTACLTAHGMCEIIPEKPEQDDTGLYMQLTVPKANISLLSNLR